MNSSRLGILIGTVLLTFLPNISWAAFLTSSGRPLSTPTENFSSLFPKSHTESKQPGDFPPNSYHQDDLIHQVLPTWSNIGDQRHYLDSPSIANHFHLGSPLISADNLFFENNPEAEILGEESNYDIPIVVNDSVVGYLELFQTKLRDRFSVWLARSGRYLPMMRETFKRYGLPEDLVYVALIESGFNPYAYSRARAVGPWQFMKGTARRYGLRINRWVDERRDPYKSTDAAARHLRDLYKRFGSWPLALASYNAGESRIHRALLKAKADNYWDLQQTRLIRRETKGYVPKFMAATIIAKNPERHGFRLEYHEPFTFDEVTVPKLANLRVIARTAGITFKKLRQLNPELRTEVTPPKPSKYTLRLPPGSKEAFITKYAKIPDKKKLLRTRYIVKRNDTLSTIARRFGTTVSQLAQVNNRSSKKILRIGEPLLIPLTSTRKPTHVDRKSHVQIVSNSKGGSNNLSKLMYRVQIGDTLWDIAKSFQIRLDDLMRHNDMNRRSRIYPGDLLILGYDLHK